MSSPAAPSSPHPDTAAAPPVASHRPNPNPPFDRDVDEEDIIEDYNEDENEDEVEEEEEEDEEEDEVAVVPDPVPVFTGPPQLVASPFLSSRADEHALALLQSQIHPHLSLYRSTMALLLRMCDRMAHYLLHRAYHGENDADSLKAKPRIEDMRPTGEEPLSPPVDPHTVHFALPAPLRPFTTELRSHTRHTRVSVVLPTLDEIAYSLDQIAKLNSKGDVGFVLPLVCAERWIEDFTRGLQLSDPDATLPAVTLSLTERVVLCALVEFFMAELLELAGNAAMDAQRTEIQVHDVWLALEGDSELAVVLAQFLPVSWRNISAAGIDSPTQLACASHPTDSDSRHTHFLDAPFASHAAAQAALNASSWYMDAEAVIEAARLLVSGALPTSDWDRRLHAAHLRPMRFIGVTPGEAAEPEIASAIVELTDAAGQTFDLTIRGPAGSGREIRSCDLIFMPRPPTYFGGTPPSTLVARMQFEHAQDASGEYRATLVLSKDTISQIDTPEHKDYQSHNADWIENIRATMSVASGLLPFSLVGPTLFVDNQPLQRRRLFTAHLIDESMVQSGIAPLPFVLSQLIAEFHTFDLPYREDKAAAQMAAAGFAPRHDPASSVPRAAGSTAVYRGQLNSGIERCVDNERALTAIWPIEKPWEEEQDQDDEGEEPEGEGDGGRNH